MSEQPTAPTTPKIWPPIPPHTVHEWRWEARRGQDMCQRCGTYRPITGRVSREQMRAEDAADRAAAAARRSA
jgi:hypothetical protein